MASPIPGLRSFHKSSIDTDADKRRDRKKTIVNVVPFAGDAALYD
jgi:hypothetical protein